VDRTPALAGLAHVTSLLVELDDVTGILAEGLAEASSVVGADAGGVLVTVPGRDGLDVLATTSHEAGILEAQQATTLEGPCVAAMTEQQPLYCASIDEVEKRWVGFGAVMSRVGFHRVLAVPMRWQGLAVGGLNFFWRNEEYQSLPDDVEGLAQTFADILTLAVVHVYPTPVDVALDQLSEALSARTLVELAKGALAEVRGVTTAMAYEMLLEMSRRRDSSLGTTAAAVLDDVQHGREVPD
jgi:ANTAR domain-containing protein/GAF domain-containing protein